MRQAGFGRLDAKVAAPLRKITQGGRMKMLVASSGAVGELVGAAEVLGYFWDAEEF